MTSHFKTSTEIRKDEHIHLAQISKVVRDDRDHRFNFEPLFSSLEPQELTPQSFLGKQLRAPLWISSMTGGTDLGKKINHNLAHACREFGLGMGLGSCRILLESPERKDDFAIRDILGEDRPLYANLGIAQIEKMLKNKETDKIQQLLEDLQADGLIIHVNPLQEWLQPEGDHYERPPIQTITELLSKINFPIIVKEVGQGMGPKSIRALLELPLAAIEFAAHGGTNFSKIELMRNMNQSGEIFEPICTIGHDAEEMVHIVNQAQTQLGERLQCKQIIISGGIKNFLDGYYLTQLCQLNAVYAQAATLLKYAREDYESLQKYLFHQIEGFKLASKFLSLKQGKEYEGAIK